MGGARTAHRCDAQPRRPASLVSAAACPNDAVSWEPVDTSAIRTAVDWPGAAARAVGRCYLLSGPCRSGCWACSLPFSTSG